MSEHTCRDVSTDDHDANHSRKPARCQWVRTLTLEPDAELNPRTHLKEEGEK